MITDQMGRLCRIEPQWAATIRDESSTSSPLLSQYARELWTDFAEGQTYAYVWTRSAALFQRMLADLGKPTFDRDYLSSTFKYTLVSQAELAAPIAGRFTKLPDDQRARLELILHNVGSREGRMFLGGDFRLSQPQLSEADDNFVFARCPAISTSYAAELIAHYATSIRRLSAWDFSVLHDAITFGTLPPDPGSTAGLEWDAHEGRWLHPELADAALTAFAIACGHDQRITVGTFHSALHTVDQRTAGSPLAHDYPSPDSALDACQIFLDWNIRAPFIPQTTTRAQLGRPMREAMDGIPPAMAAFPQLKTDKYFDTFAGVRFADDLMARTASYFQTKTGAEGLAALTAAVAAAEASNASVFAGIMATARAFLVAYAPLPTLLRDVTLHAFDKADFGAKYTRFAEASIAMGHDFWYGFANLPADDHAALKQAISVSGAIGYNLPGAMNAWFDRHARHVAAVLADVPEKFERLFADMSSVDELWNASPVDLGDYTLQLVPPDGELPARAEIRDGHRFVARMLFTTEEHTGFRFLGLKFWWPWRTGTHVVVKAAPSPAELEQAYLSVSSKLELATEKALAAGGLGQLNLSHLEVSPSLGGIASVVIVAVQLASLQQMFAGQQQSVTVVLGMVRDIGYAIEGVGEAMQAVLSSASEQLALANEIWTHDTAKLDAIKLEGLQGEAFATNTELWQEAYDARKVNAELLDAGWAGKLLRRAGWAGEFATEASRFGGEVAVPLDIVLSARAGWILLFGDDTRPKQDLDQGYTVAAVALETEGIVLFFGSGIAVGAGIGGLIAGGAIALGLFLTPAGMVMAGVAVAAIVCDVVANAFSPEQSPLQPLLDHLATAMPRELPLHGDGASLVDLKELGRELASFSLG